MIETLLGFRASVVLLKHFELARVRLDPPAERFSAFGFDAVAFDLLAVLHGGFAGRLELLQLIVELVAALCQVVALLAQVVDVFHAFFSRRQIAPASLGQFRAFWRAPSASF